MELEFHQIEARYEGLRRRNPQQERRLLASLEEVGQTCPVVVLTQSQEQRFVLIDGYKRLRALQRLKRDTIRAALWDLNEVEALLLERLMRTSQAESPLEQGWLLCELRDRFGISLAELGRRFDRTRSWVSRRLALVRDLPEIVQDYVRSGKIPAHTAMRVLVPLARANGTDCVSFIEVLLKADCSSREAEHLLLGWRKADSQVREKINADPALFLKTLSPAVMGKDLKTLSSTASRVLSQLDTVEPFPIPRKLFLKARSDCQVLFDRLEEMSSAR